jgi:hypothetical protein
MENQITQNQDKTPQSNTVELSNITGTTIINFDEIKPNSVIVIKLGVEGLQQRMAASAQIAKALTPFLPVAKEKKIIFIMMGTNESIESLDEDEMRERGWEKKEQTRIIIPR